jgi:hypothetical protein
VLVALSSRAHEVSSNDVTDDFKVIVALAVECRSEDVGDVFHKIGDELVALKN